MKNRKTLLITASFLVLSAVAVFFLYHSRENKIVTKQLFCMDTSVKLSADDDNIKSYAETIKELDKTLSAYDSNSEISKLNQTGKVTVSDTTAELLVKAKQLSEKYPQVDITAGALTKLWNVTSAEPKIPEESDIQKALTTVSSDNIMINGNEIEVLNNAEIDLGSCAKGYALDLLFDEFAKNKEKYAVVSFGSSSLLYGEKPDGKPFVTSVADPDDSNSQVLEFKTTRCFVSTSGGYERFFEVKGKKYCHIIDLDTGCPSESDLASVTVISKENGLLTDFLSTCVFIGGTENINKYLNDNSYEIIALSKDKKIYCSESIKDSITIHNNNYSFL